MRKNVLLVILLLLVTVTGCGKSNRLKCSKKTEEVDVGYTTETIVSGKMEDDVVVGADLKMIMTFEDESRAQSSYQVIMEGTSEDGVDVSINGKVITVTETQEFPEAVTKDEFIASYNEDGYVCE